MRKDDVNENESMTSNDAPKIFKTSNHLSLQNKATLPSSMLSPLIALTSFTWRVQTVCAHRGHSTQQWGGQASDLDEPLRTPTPPHTVISGKLSVSTKLTYKSEDF